MNGLSALLSLGALGLIFGLSLGVAAKKFAVERDPRVDEILAVLPGANCGACGYPGCSGLADAVVAGSAPVDACPVGKAPVAARVAEIMGVKLDSSAEPKYARVMCLGDRARAVELFEYRGIRDCRAAQLVGGGAKGCTYGCLGLGSCVNGDDGLPKVDDDLCTGCGKCVAACPRGIVQLRAKKDSVNVMCQSHARGPEVKKVCSIGCIGCGICAKNCPEKAITMVDSLAVIDNSKCTRCGICIAKCPAKCIIDYAKIEPALPVGAGCENLASCRGGEGGSQAAS